MNQNKQKAVTKEDVQYIAALSRIHLENNELELLTKDLGGILDYIKKLEKLDVAKVAPTSHVFPLKNVYREDIVCPSFSQEESLKISIAQENGAFKVPRIIE